MIKAVLTAFAASILIVGCATTWPDACPVVDNVRACKCGTLKFVISDHPDGLPTPAGIISLDCDGVKLPITAIGGAVAK